MGKASIHLNPILIARQALDEDTVQKIVVLHEELAELRSKPATVAGLLRNEEIQYAQQKLWKFERNRNYHQWFNVFMDDIPGRYKARVRELRGINMSLGELNVRNTFIPYRVVPVFMEEYIKYHEELVDIKQATELTNAVRGIVPCDDVRYFSCIK